MKKTIIFLLTIILSVTTTSAQIWKKKDKDIAASDSTGKDEKEKKEKKGGGFFQKVIAKVAKGGAKLGGTMTGATQLTSDLASVEPLVYYTANALPKAIGTIDMDFFNGWKTGGDFAGVMFMPKDRLFFYKIDGTVAINNQEADYQTTGVYTKFFDGSKAPKIFSVKTKEGQQSGFQVIAPANTIQLVSINHQKENCAIDMSKDFSIQLDGLPTDGNNLLKLKIVAQTMGIRTYYDLCYFKPAANVIIPGYVLKHLNGGNKSLNFKNAWLAVDDAHIFETTQNTGAFIKPFKYYSGTSAALPVSINNESDYFDGLAISQKEKFSQGEIKSEFSKPNAFNGKPFSEIKKIAVAACAIQGTTYFYDEKENKVLDSKITKEINFPQIPDEKLDHILADLYQRITKIVEEKFNLSILPAETVPATAAYKALQPYTNEDANTTTNFMRSYKGLQPMSTFVPLAAMFTGESSLFPATGANALLKIVLDLQLTYDGKPLLKPILTVELTGNKNGEERGMSVTQYFTSRMAGEGYKIKNGVNVTDEVLAAIVRTDDLVTMFSKGLSEIIAAENKNGEYAPIWNLQK